MAVGPMTKLAAVNRMLAALGMGTVTALGATRAATTAANTLDRVTDELLERTWWFNIEDKIYVIPSAADWMHLGPKIIEADAYDLDVRLAERGTGRRIYGLKNYRFEWTKGPTNLLSDPFNMTAGTWTNSSLTSVTADQGQDPNGQDLADRLIGVDAEQLYQDIPTASVTDGATYEFGGYFSVPSSGTGDQVRLTLAHQGGTNSGIIQFNLATGTISDVSGLAYDGQIIPVENDNYYVRARMLVDVSTYGGSAIRYSIQPDDVAGADDTVDVWGTHVKVGDASPERLTGLISFSDSPDEPDTSGAFAAVPAVARTFIMAKASRILHDQLLGSSDYRRILLRDEQEAMIRLLQADDRVQDANELTDNDTLSFASQTRRRNTPLTWT